MKYNVKLSTYSIIISSLTLILIGGTSIYFINHGVQDKSFVLICMMILILGFALFYSPVALSVDENGLNIHRTLKTKHIPLSEISSVTLVSPTMAEKRIFGSGGWFGYWGRMKEPTLGHYFAYYGKASDCFLVRLTDGSQYMLSCDDPVAVVDFINSKIKSRK